MYIMVLLISMAVHISGSSVLWFSLGFYSIFPQDMPANVGNEHYGNRELHFIAYMGDIVNMNFP